MKPTLTIKTAELDSLFKDLLSQVNTVENVAKNICACESFDSYSLIFLQNANHLEKIVSKPPAILITTEKLANDLPESFQDQCSIFTSPNVGLAHALIKQHYDDYACRDEEWSNRHSSAIIHESVSIGSNCRIGPKVVIGANVRIGDNTLIRSGSVIERESTIGSNCVIHSMVNIGFGSTIGNQVVIRPNTVIANEGFGLSPDSEGKFYRVPHSGNVILEDDVQIGSNCNIDRGTYGETRIKRGTKMDALCHIAHNVEVGEDCILTAQCVIAGSSKIGNRVMMSGKSGIADHVNICDDVTLLHRASVFSDISKKGKWAGTPAKPFKEYMQDMRAKKQVGKLTSRLEQLEKKLGVK